MGCLILSKLNNEYKHYSDFLIAQLVNQYDNIYGEFLFLLSRSLLFDNKIVV